ncbi:Hypothetical predicted protein [Podarcis lilfordi]|uniref:Uncharacterized protein n=1 Tax=Podarcis lilfordi TaxID=74358 RepID=A0AA35NWA9_9SAUR|nr:Hypothetical predicted protein [Podarcis lilfordi]
MGQAGGEPPVAPRWRNRGKPRTALPPPSSHGLSLDLAWVTTDFPPGLFMEVAGGGMRASLLGCCYVRWLAYSFFSCCRTFPGSRRLPHPEAAVLPCYQPKARGKEKMCGYAGEPLLNLRAAFSHAQSYGGRMPMGGVLEPKVGGATESCLL